MTPTLLLVCALAPKARQSKAAPAASALFFTINVIIPSVPTKQNRYTGVRLCREPRLERAANREAEQRLFLSKRGRLSKGREGTLVSRIIRKERAVRRHRRLQVSIDDTQIIRPI